MKRTCVYYCPNCVQALPATKEAPRHVIHLALTVVTAGVWAPRYIWLFRRSRRAKWQCTKCTSLH